MSKRWSDLRASLIERGVEDEDVLDDIRRMTAKSRHVARCDATAEAAGLGDTLRAWARIAVDLIGVGGKCGAEGAGSDRLPCFSLLGSGGKNGGDGPSYMAAAREALWRLQEIITSTPVQREDSEFVPGGVLPSLHAAEGGVFSARRLYGDTPRIITLDIPPRWRRAVALRAILGHRELFSGEDGVFVTPEGYSDRPPHVPSIRLGQLFSTEFVEIQVTGNLSDWASIASGGER